jgi:DnaK suppressor protein
MSTIDTEPFRKLLEEEKARLTHAMGSVDHTGDGTMADELGEITDGGSDNHLADTASATYDRELDEGLEEGAQHTLADIDAALQRIDDGTYGVCEIGGEPIGEERLKALPWARLCIDHQRSVGG